MSDSEESVEKIEQELKSESSDGENLIKQKEQQQFLEEMEKKQKEREREEREERERLEKQRIEKQRIVEEEKRIAEE